MSDPKAVYVQMLRKGEVIQIKSLADEWFLEIVDGFTVDVYRRPNIVDHQVQVSADLIGRYACAPTIKEHRTTYLFGNNGISEHAILVKSFEKVSTVPN